jgi:hypothetical protein
VNSQVLIESVVRQTTILIAQLATSGGVRAPLAHVANQVFLDLARELGRQGISRKVSADMFGMALRSYRRRIQQLSEGRTERDRSLWEAVLDFISQDGVVTRSAVVQRFHRDDESLVRAVLHDLVESGLVFRIGRGEASAYRSPTGQELAELGSALGSDDAIGDELIWVLVFREAPVTLERLRELAPSARDLDANLERLRASDRIQFDDRGRYRSKSMVIPLGESAGWEAALLDHFQVMVRTLCARLASSSAANADEMGGSTYSYTVYPGHPHEREVLGLLREFRERHTELRQRVQGYNALHPPPATYQRVTLYGGQNVTLEGESEQGENDDT